MVVLVAGQSELDKDVEIIPGKTVPQAHPLDAKFAPQYANDIYGQPVSWNANSFHVAKLKSFSL